MAGDSVIMRSESARYDSAARDNTVAKLSRSLAGGENGVTILEFLDYTGVAVFAATGALSASRKQLDIIGFLFLAAATGIGGGTFRDVILGATPVFWVVNPTYLIVCVSVALLVFVLAHRIESRYRLLLWLDAMGVSAYCVMGAAKGLAATGSPTVAITTGVLTASFGGILRDLLAGEPSVLLRPEIYITAALLHAVDGGLAASCGDRGMLRILAVEGAKTYFDTNTSDHHHFFVEGENHVLDIPVSNIAIGNLPEPPEGMEIAHVDVIIRLRPKKG